MSIETLKPIQSYQVGQHPLVKRLMKGIFDDLPFIQKTYMTITNET